jgi:alkylation response protein AidB-like acyl-CoA dehydrogenase
LYKLYGYKWFSSATDSDISITLARIVNEDNKLTQGLTMFFLNTRNSDGSLNNIEVHKLKNKLGTRQLPTAELLLDGTLAYQVNQFSI